MASLRKEHRLALDVAWPASAPPQEVLKELQGRFNNAQRAFDNGNYAEVARITYTIHEVLKSHPSTVKSRYGEPMYKRISDIRKAFSSIENRERHYDSNGGAFHGGVDRPLALHLLSSAQALTALWFAA